MNTPFNADEINKDNWDPMLRVRKKPVIVHAARMNFPEGFEVTTKEGKLRGKPGDYLMIGVDGEKYPIDADIFARTYDVLDESKPVVVCINENCRRPGGHDGRCEDGRLI